MSDRLNSTRVFKLGDASFTSDKRIASPFFGMIHDFSKNNTARIDPLYPESINPLAT